MFCTRIHEFSTPNVYDETGAVARAPVAPPRSDATPPDATTASVSTPIASAGVRAISIIRKSRVGICRIVGSFRLRPYPRHSTGRPIDQVNRGSA